MALRHGKKIPYLKNAQTGRDVFVFYQHEDEAGITLVGENRCHVRWERRGKRERGEEERGEEERREKRKRERRHREERERERE